MRENAQIRTLKPSLFLLGATAIAWGCGGSDSTPPSPADAAVAANNPDAALVSSDVTGTANGPDGALSPSDGAGPPPASYCTDKPALAGLTDVSGIWVIRAVATQIIVAPVVGTLRPKTVFYVLTTLTQSGSDVIAAGRYCDRSEIDQPGSLTTVVVPDRWAHTEKPLNRSGVFAPGNDGIPVLVFPTLVEFAGMVPDLPDSALPTSPGDPRVIDEDNDGHPGITINLSGVVQGSVYSVQRQTTAIAAVAVASDRFEGKLDFTSEQRVLDSTSPLITTLYGQAVASTDPTPCSGTFAMVKVADLATSAIDAGGANDGGTVSCEWVRAHETALFPQ